VLDFKKQKLLVIAPHPDDEVVGCGGLIKKIKDEDGKVYVLFLTVGDTKDFSKKGMSFAKDREKEIESVARFLKFSDYHIAFKGNSYHLKLDLLGQKALMDVIERDCPVAIEMVKPTIIAFPSPFSYNQDHRIAAAAAHACLRSAPKVDKHFVPLVLSYEEPSDGWTFHSQPEMNFFVELNAKDIIAKQKAMQLYTSQDRINNNPRSIEILKNLDRLRGSQMGASLAEAFFAHRIIT
jgi:LmbE family N-acetylglucosaminyl deacetylase